MRMPVIPELPNAHLAKKKRGKTRRERVRQTVLDIEYPSYGDCAQQNGSGMLFTTQNPWISQAWNPIANVFVPGKQWTKASKFNPSPNTFVPGQKWLTVKPYLESKGYLAAFSNFPLSTVVIVEIVWPKYLKYPRTWCKTCKR
jgi:hypothetical protein